MTKEKQTPFAQVPIGLLFSKTVSNSAKLIYCFFHSYCNPQNKNLDSEPRTKVGIPTLAKVMKVTKSYINQLIVELRDEGWLRRSELIGGRYVWTTLNAVPDKEQIEKRETKKKRRKSEK